jgi:sec-independent protein translocase protein TatC
MPDLKDYMGLTLKLLIIFGLIFELPLVAFYLSKAGIVNAKMLAKKRRYAILTVFIVSAIITPPDVVSMILIALPLLGLYELGILIAKVFGKKEPPDDAA